MHTHSIDFTKRKENNSASQLILDENAVKINNSCDKVLKLLQEGKRLTVYSAMVDYGISSLPRRILDIKQKLGIDVKSRLIEKRYKEYYL